MIVDEILNRKDADDMCKSTKRRRRLQEAKVLIQIEILNGNLKRAVNLAERFGITPKEFGKLAEMKIEKV